MKLLLAVAAACALVAWPLRAAFAQAEPGGWDDQPPVPGASTGTTPEQAQSAAAPAAAQTASAPVPDYVFTPETVNDAQPDKVLQYRDRGPAVLRAQILLDRVHFEAGEIDGSFGWRQRIALYGFQRANDLDVTGTIDDDTWAALTRDTAPALVRYRIKARDLKGPFLPLPHKMADKAKLGWLGYTSVEEELGEKFHIKPQFLQAMNPGKDFRVVGEEIVVPNVYPPRPLQKGAEVVVTKLTSTVAVMGASGRLIAQFPASMGSEHDPLPIGAWEITGFAFYPKFHYNPKLFWDAKEGEERATIPPGPNNPVGVVWIDLSKKHYGIHGTPEPGSIGRSESHGCIRLSNWDATLLAHAVYIGMPALLVKK